MLLVLVLVAALVGGLLASRQRQREAAAEAAAAASQSAAAASASAAAASASAAAALEQAKNESEARDKAVADDWDRAYAAAEADWNELQTAIRGCETYLSELDPQLVKDPTTVAALESELESAKATENQHDSITRPRATGDIKNSTLSLNEIAQQYSDASARLSRTRGTVVVVDPFRGQFDYSDSSGYTYTIQYSIELPVASVDTTLGKPGEVGITITWPSPTVTVTNTTPGKRAPVPDPGTISLLYPNGQLSALRDMAPGNTAFPESTDLVEFSSGAIYEYDTGLLIDTGDWRINNGMFGQTVEDMDVGESLTRNPSFGEYHDGGRYTSVTITVPETNKDAFVDAVTKGIVGVMVHKSSFGYIDSVLHVSMPGLSPVLAGQ
jgi:hypothetical protein